jgi:putative nucleotidyltransferase with HDIG domain
MIETMPNLQSSDREEPDLTTLIAKVKDLPPLPSVVLRALEMTLDPEVSIRDLQAVISKDQALSAKILRIVNSAMYSLRRDVSTVSHAVSVLGVETVKSLIMAVSVERVFQSARDLGTKLMSDHSWGTALAARSIARRVRYENTEEALVCGLMHDLGKPVLLQNLQPSYTEIISQVYKGDSTFHQLELETFGFSHAHVGALLAKKWNFPPQLSEAVSYHHNPISAPSYRKLACIIGLANSYMIFMGIGFEVNRELDLKKLPAAEFLALDGAALDVVEAEIRANVYSTAALRS